MINKVYCTDCKFFGEHNSDVGRSVWCDHPTNVYISHRFDGPVKNHRQHPQDMNEFADCKLYEPKPLSKLQLVRKLWWD